MRKRVFMFLTACPLLVLSVLASGQASVEKQSLNQQADDEKEPVSILEVGAATSWNIQGGAATFAPNLAAEITPIEGWLELEAGVSPFYTRKSTEWDTDLLLKKPWTLSPAGWPTQARVWLEWGSS